MKVVRMHVCTLYESVNERLMYIHLRTVSHLIWGDCTLHPPHSPSPVSPNSSAVPQVQPCSCVHTHGKSNNSDLMTPHASTTQLFASHSGLRYICSVRARAGPLTSAAQRWCPRVASGETPSPPALMQTETVSGGGVALMGRGPVQ